MTLSAHQLQFGYRERLILDGLNVTFPEGKVTILIGGNGCGKSTLLKNLARIYRPSGGEVCLDGERVHQMDTKALARKLALLPQDPKAPESLTVAELVALGRFPHQGLGSRLSAEDDALILKVLEQVGMAAFAQRRLGDLSGGQRQRAWIAMALAQDTPWILLDEPTTFLDIAHQLELLLLLQKLNREQGKSVVMVLHELNQAARFADHLVAMKAGAIVAQGTPQEVLTPALLKTVFNVDAQVVPDPMTGSPLCLCYGPAA